MFPRKNPGRRRRPFGPGLISALALLVVVVAVPGCGGSDPYAVKTVSAAGTVTYKGKPVPKGTILFEPMDDKGRPASGTIEDGKFTLSTYREGDGAVPGKHKVAVVATEEKKARDGDTTVKYIIPESYASAETSGVTAEVPPGGSSDLRVAIQ
jgi:hypothetical protein